VPLLLPRVEAKTLTLSAATHIPGGRGTRSEVKFRVDVAGRMSCVCGNWTTSNRQRPGVGLKLTRRAEPAAGHDPSDTRSRPCDVALYTGARPLIVAPPNGAATIGSGPFDRTNLPGRKPKEVSWKWLEKSPARLPTLPA